MAEIKLYKPKYEGRVLAVQLTKDNVETVASWCVGRIVEEIDPRDEDKRYVAINVPTKDGNERLSQGQFLVLESDENHFKIMGPTEFQRRYQED